MPSAQERLDLLTRLLAQQLLDHPLPWRVERDWTHEVIAADKTVIAKFPNTEEAAKFIELAEEHKRMSATSLRETEQALGIAE